MEIKETVEVKISEEEVDRLIALHVFGDRPCKVIGAYRAIGSYTFELLDESEVHNG